MLRFYLNSQRKLDEIKGIEDCRFKQGRKIDIIPRSGHMKFVVDGEIAETAGLR